MGPPSAVPDVSQTSSSSVSTPAISPTPVEDTSCRSIPSHTEKIEEKVDKGNSSPSPMHAAFTPPVLPAVIELSSDGGDDVEGDDVEAAWSLTAMAARARLASQSALSANKNTTQNQQQQQQHEKKTGINCQSTVSVSAPTFAPTVTVRPRSATGTPTDPVCASTATPDLQAAASAADDDVAADDDAAAQLRAGVCPRSASSTPSVPVRASTATPDLQAAAAATDELEAVVCQRTVTKTPSAPAETLTNSDQSSKKESTEVVIAEKAAIAAAYQSDGKGPSKSSTSGSGSRYSSLPFVSGQSVTSYTICLGDSTPVDYSNDTEDDGEEDRFTSQPASQPLREKVKVPVPQDADEHSGGRQLAAAFSFVVGSTTCITNSQAKRSIDQCCSQGQGLKISRGDSQSSSTVVETLKATPLAGTLLHYCGFETWYDILMAEPAHDVFLLGALAGTAPPLSPIPHRFYSLEEYICSFVPAIFREMACSIRRKCVWSVQGKHSFKDPVPGGLYEVRFIDFGRGFFDWYV